VKRTVKRFQSYVPEKMGRPVGEEGRDMILHIQQGSKEDGFTVPMTKVCRWFDVPRRTVYYKPVKSAPKVQERFAAPIKHIIEAEPSFGYRTLASLL
jgi:putative transposase